MLDKGFLAFFQADGVDYPLTLKTFQTGFDHVPFGTVDHDRHTGNIGFGRQKINEFDHRRFGIQHRIIHIDVDDLCAIFDLLTGNLKGCVVIFLDDQVFELDRSCDVRAFADIDES